jgi:hypothetical protein
MRFDVTTRGARRGAPLAWSVAAVAAVTLGALAGAAQERPTMPSTTDPRVGLKAGRTDAGVAAKNMTLVSSMAKPAGFFDPKNPAGLPTPPEQPAGAAATPAATPAPATPAPATTSPTPTSPSRA